VVTLAPAVAPVYLWCAARAVLNELMHTAQASDAS
jgi:hypothetical protein